MIESSFIQQTSYAVLTRGPAGATPMVVKVGIFDEVSKAMDGGDRGMLGDGSTGGADADMVGGCGDDYSSDGGGGDGGDGGGSAGGSAGGDADVAGGGGGGDCDGGGGCYSDAD